MDRRFFAACGIPTLTLSKAMGKDEKDYKDLKDGPLGLIAASSQRENGERAVVQISDVLSPPPRIMVSLWDRNTHCGPKRSLFEQV
jgi:hypothetical protein